jgi:hypothetical protein
MAMTPEEIAAKLTKAQRNVLRALPEGEFADWTNYSRHRSVRMGLNNSGCTEPERKGPVTLWFRLRVTPLGLAVREVLERQS